jgi:hypothetical protein
LNVRIIRLLGDPEAFTRTGVILFGERQHHGHASSAESAMIRYGYMTLS